MSRLRDRLHDAKIESAAPLPVPDPALAFRHHRPVLLVLHQETSTPGRIGNALRAMGYPLDIRRPRFGDPLPETFARHSGAVIFGGPQSANDPDDFIKREIAWTEAALGEGRPFLGICLGAQMLAKSLGATVSRHRQGREEIGYYPIRPTAAGRALCGEWPGHVYQWHCEGFNLPSGCELLAEGDDFPVQAIRCGNAFGLQFHPDVTTAMMHRWTTRGAARFDAPGAHPRAQHFAYRAVYDVMERAWLTAFLDRWLRGAPCETPLAMAAE
ncbi:MAG: glutamine amidotransferase [Pseudomonadota bacterium]